MILDFFKGTSERHMRLVLTKYSLANLSPDLLVSYQGLSLNHLVINCYVWCSYNLLVSKRIILVSLFKQTLIISSNMTVLLWE